MLVVALAERMRIQENGDVGIGDYSSFTGLSPGSKLEIIGKSTSDEALKLTHRASRDANHVTDGLATPGTLIQSIYFQYNADPNTYNQDKTMSKISTKNYHSGGTGWYNYDDRIDAGLSFFTSSDGMS